MLLVIDVHVVTVEDVALRPRPWMRTHTLASRFDTSMPAQRGWITAMTVHLLSYPKILLWKVFRRELKETEVSLTCSQATIDIPRITATGLLSSPTLYRRARGQQGGAGSPKHPLSVNPDHGERNHAPTAPARDFHPPHRGAAP